MSETNDASSILELLRQPVFAALAKETVRDYADWDQLAERALPPGLSLNETWELLGTIRKFGAIETPLSTTDGRSFWYSLNRESRWRLQFIKKHCNADSIIHRVVQEREGHRFLVHSRVLEAFAVCQLGGVVVDRDRATTMLHERLTPQTDTDRLVLNSYEMMNEVDTFTSQQFSPELIRSLYDRVSFGVDLDNVPRMGRRTNLAGTISPESAGGRRGTRDILQEICDYANLVTGEPTEPATIKGYMILSAMGYWQPLPDLNEIVARQMLRIFSVKRGYPVLSYLPSSLWMLEWINGELKPGTTRFSNLERRTVIPGEIDGSEDILTHLEITTAAVSELLAYINRTQAAEEGLRSALDSDDRLNYRQRAVLSMALMHPDSEFRISSHQTEHRTVYQTARTDLLDLAEKGYLVKTRRGKAFVFVPDPNLPAKLGDLA